MRLEGDYVSLTPLPRLCSDGGETIGPCSIVTFGADSNTHSENPESLLRIDAGSGFVPPSEHAVTAGIFAQDDFEPFLGADFFPWMILAFGAAMVIGNVLALLRPPASVTADRRDDGRGGPRRPPLTRSVVMIVVGLAAAAWGLASLLS